MTFHGKSKTLIYFKMSFELLIVYVEMLKMESLAKEENFEDKTRCFHSKKLYCPTCWYVNIFMVQIHCAVLLRLTF